MEIKKVGVVGCGLMGSGIAEISAKAGFDTVVREVNDEAVEAGRARIQKSLDRAVGKLAGRPPMRGVGALLDVDPTASAAQTLAASVLAEWLAGALRARLGPTWTLGKVPAPDALAALGELSLRFRGEGWALIGQSQSD